MPSRPACGGGLLDIVHGHDTHVVVPLQGSGTFSVEAAVATVVPRDGHVLVLDNGAYCKRAAQLTELMGRRVSVMSFAEDEPVSAAALDARLKAVASITHVVLIHCETGAGVLNPLAEVAAVCERHGKGLIVDAMSSFARAADRRAHDALRRAGGRQRQVPGRRARHGLRVPAQGRARRLRRQQPEPGDGPARPARLHGEDRPVALHAAHARGGGAGRGHHAVRGRRRPAGAAGALHRQLPHAGRRHVGHSACSPSWRRSTRRPSS